MVIAFAAMTLVAATFIMKQCYRRIHPYFYCDTIPHLLHSEHTTNQKDLVTFDFSSDFVKNLNFDRHDYFDVLIRCFFCTRPSLNLDNPYRCEPKTRGSNPFLSAIDILGLVLKYTKSTAWKYEICGIICVVPSTVSLWVCL